MYWNGAAAVAVSVGMDSFWAFTWSRTGENPVKARSLKKRWPGDTDKGS